MKNNNKRPDHHSFSPISFIPPTSIHKPARQEYIKVRHQQPDPLADRSFTINGKDKQNVAYSRNQRAAVNLGRHWKVNDPLNHTVITDHRRNSSLEDVSNNNSYIDPNYYKNTSYFLGNLQPLTKDRDGKVINHRSENTPHRGYSNNISYGAAIFPHEINPDMLFPSRKDSSVGRKGEKMLNMTTFSRKPTETNLDTSQQQQNNGKRPLPPPREDGNLFPKIKSIASNNLNNKFKEDVKNDKMVFIEKTYSLGPYKRKNTRNMSNAENQVYTTNLKRDDSFITRGLNQTLLQTNQTLGQTNKSKGSSNDTRPKRWLEKTNQSKTSNIPLTLETVTQGHSPTEREREREPIKSMNNTNAKGSSSNVNYRAKSNNNSMLRINEQQNTTTTQNYQQQKDVKPVNKDNIKKISDRMDRTYKASQDLLTSSKETLKVPNILDASYNSNTLQVPTDQTNQTIPNEEIHNSSQIKRGRKYNRGNTDLEVRIRNKSNVSAISGISIMDSSDINVSAIHHSTNTDDKVLYSFDISDSPQKDSAQLSPEKCDKSPLRRQESNENVLDEFAEKSMIVSVQDQNQSLNYSSTCKGQFDDALETSLISYLDEKGMIRVRTRKDIEMTLSATKHPKFRRSKIVVSKGLNSSDKDHLNLQSTNMTVISSQMRNESMLSKQTKEDVFRPDSSADKSRNLGIDFNFEDETKAYEKNKNNLFLNQISPSFPVHTLPSMQSSAEAKFVNIPDFALDAKAQKEILRDSIIEDQAKTLEAYLSKGSQDFELSQSQSKLGSQRIVGDNSPKAIRVSLPKPLYFHANNRLNKFAGSGEGNIVEQSFNENPMNSLNNDRE